MSTAFDDGLTQGERTSIVSEIMARHGNRKFGTDEWRIAFLDYLIALCPLREVGIENWFDVHKDALLRALRGFVSVPRQSRMRKNDLIRLCRPILDDKSPHSRRSELLAAIRREADAYEMAVRGKPLPTKTIAEQLEVIPK